MKRVTRQILDQLIERSKELGSCRASIEEGYSLLYECFTTGHKVLTCGNGGSAADSEHIVGELMKAFRLPRPLRPEQAKLLRAEFGDDGEAAVAQLQQALPAISLVSQSSLITAFANDVSADMVFAQQVLGYGQSGDVLIAMSTSGRSKNVVNAAKTARAFGLRVIGLTGEAESPLSDVCSVAVRVPARETALVQEYHLKVYHALCAMIEAELFTDE
ncbi:MAG TPA: SIS domain-containing protein [Spirochaetia bacterium]|nr:SIS domain-containing protein [Spirochaetia bacterium]